MVHLCHACRKVQVPAARHQCAACIARGAEFHARLMALKPAPKPAP